MVSLEYILSIIVILLLCVTDFIKTKMETFVTGS